MLVPVARTALAALVLAPLAVGCTALGGGGEASGSCAFVVDYRDREYVDVGRVDYELGAEVGTARHAVCVDEGGGEEDTGDDLAAEDRTVFTAYAVKGIDTDDAIAVRESPGGELSVMVDPRPDEPIPDAAERVFGGRHGGGGTDGEGDGVTPLEAPEACGGDDGSCAGGATAAKCAFLVEYGGESYAGRGEADFEPGAKLGTVRTVYCDDTPGDVDATPEPEVYEAYAVKGLDPGDAIAVRRSADEEPLFMTRLGDDLPPEVEERLTER